jgi:deazaflavin-dependent oxidoreductase (nitroreductase family)
VYPSDRHRLRRGLTSPRSYLALWAMARVFTTPVEALRRYVDTSHGSYPWRADVRTPQGTITLDLPDGHDVRTVNEIFCRHDYGTGAPRVVVDVGANIGVSAAYFLSRRPDALVHAFEPVPGNVEWLRRNVARFGDRVVLDTRAVSPGGGPVRFFVEGVGRYSGMADYYQHDLPHEEVVVDSVAIADALDGVLAAEGHVDLLKIDTEGSEEALVRAVRPDQWRRIRAVRYERDDHVVDHPPADVAPGWRAHHAVGSHGMPGWLRATFRAPNAVYDAGAGRLLGNRFVRLTHTGRRSGREFHTVLEVVERNPATGAVTVVSGFGRHSDWYRNVVAGGPVWVDLGRGARRADHEVLPLDDAERVIADYERRNRIIAPVIRRALGAMTGTTYRGTPEDRRRLVEQLPVVRFRPAAATAHDRPGS